MKISTIRIFRYLTAMAAVVLLSACAGTGNNNGEMTAADFQQQQGEQARADEINQQLLALAAEAEVETSVYRVGPNDTVRVQIYGVDEVSDEFRVDGSGYINLPLVGYTQVSGYTVSEVEDLIAEAYGESYIRDRKSVV